MPPTDLNPRRDPPLDFPIRALGELTKEDYAELGFICGLEVHQQLASKGKLFCRCPAGRRVSRVDAEVLRHMRPTLSELGKYDGCALMEFKTNKEIVYLLERTTSCTYELDDTPPFPIDEEAVQIALEIATLLDLSLVSEIQVMRKQYLDGSIPTGFQRTAMLGVGGVIPFAESELGRDRELRIRQLTLEEDSCREVADLGHRITFRTDRLGTPLVETVTEPDLLTPADVAAGGRLLARIARASRKVRRGPGAARQDVNVSIAGSRRIELKGTPSHRLLPLLVHNEALRQLALLRIRQRLLARGVEQSMLSITARGLPWEVSDRVLYLGSLLQDCTFTPVRQALERGELVCSIKLAGFGGLLSERTQPGRTFAHELAERVRVIACPTARPFLASSDAAAQGPSEAVWNELRKAHGADREDALILLWAPEQDAATAVREVLVRATEALIGVPAETRQPHADGTTGFERILPGAERMYPDTDTPPLPIPDAWVEQIRTNLAERPWQLERRYVRAGLTAAAARRLADAPWASLFDELAPTEGSVARRLAFALEKRLPHHWRQSKHRSLPEAERLRPLVTALERGKLHADGFEPALDRLLREPERSAEEILRLHAATEGKGDVLARRIGEALAESAARGPMDRAVLLRWAMGFVMRPFPRGRHDPQELRARLAAELHRA